MRSQRSQMKNQPSGALGFVKFIPFLSAAYEAGYYIAKRWIAPRVYSVKYDSNGNYQNSQGFMINPRCHILGERIGFFFSAIMALLLLATIFVGPLILAKYTSIMAASNCGVPATAGIMEIVATNFYGATCFLFTLSITALNGFAALLSSCCARESSSLPKTPNKPPSQKRDDYIPEETRITKEIGVILQEAHKVYQQQEETPKVLATLEKTDNVYPKEAPKQGQTGGDWRNHNGVFNTIRSRQLDDLFGSQAMGEDEVQQSSHTLTQNL